MLFLKKCIFFFTWILTSIFKRDKKIILCAGWFGHRFADNSRYIFLYLNEHKKYLGLKKIIWITNNPQIGNALKKQGYSVCKRDSLLGIYYHLRAFYFFYDQFRFDFHTSLTSNSKCINLWHGIPIKKFGLFNKKEKRWDLEKDYLFTCSYFGDQTLGKCFKTQLNHFIHGMYPRNYYLLHPIPFLLNEETIYLQKIKAIKERGEKILFYLPTFRKNSKLCFLGETDNDKINEVLSFLKQKGYCLLSKIHFRGFEIHQDGFQINNQMFVNLPPHFDIYPFLKESDVLLTDYSSVLFDFLYLDRDIICFPYDLQTYKEKDQGLLLDYDTLPVDYVYNIEELTRWFINPRIPQKVEQMKKARKEWLARCFENKTINDTIKNIFTTDTCKS